MKTSLRTKLSISYIFIAAICVLLISIVSNMYLEKYFREYVKKNQERRNNDIVIMLAHQYSKDKTWKKDAIEVIGIRALEEGLILSIVDIEKNIIWDATEYNSGMCQQMIEDMSRNMYSRYPNWKGAYKESTYTIKQGDVKIGYVQIGYYGPFFFNNADLNFINALNRVIFVVGILSLFAALSSGYFMAKRLSTPIKRVTDTAEMISKGKFEDRCHEKSNVIEIIKLTDTVNGLAETLQKQGNLRKKLTADVAHELRTPLATLQSHMEAMIDGIWEADKERLKSCHEEITRLSKMVGDLEELAKYEGDTVILQKSNVILSEVINNVLRNFEPEFKSKQITVEYRDGRVKLEVDRDKLSQVMVNLISNAVKYTDKGDIIRIVDTMEDGYAKISVIDTGIGIDNRDLPYIFERFYRADKSRNRGTGGTGIGLAIVKTIVEAHGGTIKVKSEQGKGTEFTVLLPV